MAINFPLIDPNRTQFNKGIGTEIGTPIAQAILAASQRRKEQAERAAMLKFLETGERSGDMPSGVLEKLVAEKAKPPDLDAQLRAQKLAMDIKEEERKNAARIEQERADTFQGSILGSGGVKPGGAPDVLRAFSSVGPTPGSRNAATERLKAMLEVGPKVDTVPTPERRWAQRADDLGLTGVERYSFIQQEAAKEAGLTTGARAGAGTQGRLDVINDPKNIAQSSGRITAETEARNAGRPLPQNAQDNLTGALDAWRALNIMEQGLGESGIIEGRLSELQAALGFNQKAINFKAARNQFKLSAQALIKGVPSNFDVQTLIETLPSLPSATPTNKARIGNARASIRILVQNTLAYYKYTGYQMPPEVNQLIQMFDIDANSVPPWNGLGDPLQPNARNAPGSGGASGLTPEQEAEQYLRGTR